LWLRLPLQVARQRRYAAEQVASAFAKRLNLRFGQAGCGRNLRIGQSLHGDEVARDCFAAFPLGVIQQRDLVVQGALADECCRRASSSALSCRMRLIACWTGSWATAAIVSSSCQCLKKVIKALVDVAVEALGLGEEIRGGKVAVDNADAVVGVERGDQLVAGIFDGAPVARGDEAGSADEGERLAVHRWGVGLLGRACGGGESVALGRSCRRAGHAHAAYASMP
jgi:hypothetical protein